MKFALLLLLSPLVVSSFTSLCPQQPNSVVVNCNNQNPYPFITTTPTRVTGRVLDIGYNKPPAGSKLQLQFQRSDSSEESSESDESSEEINDHRVPLTVITHPQLPSFHTTTTINNRLDFLNSLRRGGSGAVMNNLRSIPRNHIPGHIVSTSENLGTSTGSGVLEVRPDQTIVVDETHGHGHSGQYNHGVGQNNHGHNHGHGHGHHHGHEHGPHGHEHMHENMNSQIPSHILIPTHITRPTTTISGAHIIPEHYVPIGQLLSSGLENVVIDDPAHLLFDRSNPRIDGAKLQVTGIDPIAVPATVPYNNVVDLLHDTRDRLVLSRRGYRALDNPLTTIGTYELYPQDLLNRIITTISIPRVVQEGLTTEINCDPIPLVSEIPQVEVTQGATVQQTMLPTTSTLGDKLENVSTVSHTEMLPGSSSVMSTETINGPSRIPLTQGESTVTKVTTTKTEERPTGDTITLGMPVQTGSTVSKVTTTKVEAGPTITDVINPSETIKYETPTQMGSTVTKVTTTKVEERPNISEVETFVNGMPTQTFVQGTPSEIGSSSTVTKVTTTKVESRPTTADVVSPSETIIYETPTQMGSTVTKVTTTKIDGRPVNTDVIIPTESIVRETPAQIGSTITKVTTTNLQERPMETIVNEAPVEKTGTTVTKVTTTTTEYRPNEAVNGIHRKTETVVPNPVVGDVLEELINVDTSPLSRLVRPIRDGTYRYDSYRQRMGPLVYRV